MSDTHLILFPHTHLTGADAKSLLGRFHGLVVCQPWYMDDPIPDNENPNRGTLRVVHPPETHKPPEDFKGLQTEYREWVRQNQGDVYAALYAASQDANPADDSLWEIREVLRRDSRAGRDDHEANVLRWHMVLHLNREFQEHQQDIRLLVKRIKEQTSPLEDVLGEEDTPARRLLDDLPEPVDHPFGDDHRLRRVCEAWIHLFGDQLKDSFSLVTLNRCVLNVVAEQFQTHGAEPVVKKERFGSPHSESEMVMSDTLYLPETLPSRGADPNSMVPWLMGKRIVLWGG